MKSKAIESRLIELVESPLDAHILGVTFKMLSKKQPEKMKSILMRYATEEITPADLGMAEEYAEDYIPQFHWIVEQLKYSALGNLRYCSGDDVMAVLQKYFDCDNKGFRDTAKDSYEYIMKRMLKKGTRYNEV